MSRKSLRAIAEQPTVAVRTPAARGVVVPDPALRVILDRVSGRYDDSCPCADCERRRAEPFQCGTCGYSGAPHMYPCGCPRERRESIKFFRAALAKPWPLDWRTTPDEARAKIARLEAEAPDAMCPSGNDNCSHGLRSCPVCGVGETGVEDVSVGPEELVGIIRDVRAALRARGLV